MPAAASHYPETLNVSRILILEEEEARARADVVIHGRRVCTRTERGPEKSVASHTIYCTTITAATNKSKTERRFNPNVRFKDIRSVQRSTFSNFILRSLPFRSFFDWNGPILDV